MRPVRPSPLRRKATAGGGLGVTIDTARPTISGTPQFLFATAPHRLTYAFSENVGPTLASGDFAVQLLPSTNVNTSVSYDGGTNTGTVTFPDGGGLLADGRYRSTLLSAGVTDIAGNQLDVPADADHILDFFFLRGDANHDALVNLADYNILAGNYGQSPRNFTQGDFNYDGLVNLADYNILAGRYGTSVGPEGLSGRVSKPPFAPFSTRLIEQFELT
jgi:hypothetical protein